MSSIFGLRYSYMLEYCWLFALLLSSARCFTGVEGKWTLLPPILPRSQHFSFQVLEAAFYCPSILEFKIWNKNFKCHLKSCLGFFSCAFTSWQGIDRYPWTSYPFDMNKSSRIFFSSVGYMRLFLGSWSCSRLDKWTYSVHCSVIHISGGPLEQVGPQINI